MGGSQPKIAAFCFHTETSSLKSVNSLPCHVAKKTFLLTQNNTEGVRPGFKHSGSPADILQQQPTFGLQGSGSSPATAKELTGGRDASVVPVQGGCRQGCTGGKRGWGEGVHTWIS